MEKLLTEDDIELVQNENEDIIHLYEPLEFKIDAGYEYIKNGKVFSLFSNLLYYGIAFPILTILNKIVYDLKIEGKENIKNLQTGAVSVSNHVLFLDCTMVGLSFGLKKIYFTTREGSFKIPFVRKLIKLLRAVPIPSKLENKMSFVKEIDKAIKSGNIIHFYPEKALWPYYEKIRKFQNGAFNFAIRNDVPIIPIVITFRNPKGIRKLFKRKKDVTVKILEPIKYVGNEDSEKHCIEELKEQVHKVMQDMKCYRSYQQKNKTSNHLLNINKILHYKNY